MRRAGYLVVILVVLALIAGRALSDRGGEVISGTRAFAIDGRQFFVEDPGGDGFSPLERELAKREIDTPGISNELASVLDSPSVEPLREEPAKKNAPSHPRGLAPDHVLILETPTGPVEITFGRVVCEEKKILTRLRSSGWECRDADAQGAPGTIAQITNGKETSFVLLEKNERRFLAIRRALR